MTGSDGRRDQRRHQRRKAELAVRLTPIDGATVTGALVLDAADLSEGGAFLHSEFLLEEGELVNLEIPLSSGKVIKATGRVVRLDRRTARPGIGLEFVRLGPEDKKLLAADLENRLAAS